MIRGHVDARYVSFVPVTVGGREWQAVVDSGFNGDLELPQLVHSATNARFRHRIRSLLAGGQTIEEDVYTVDFEFDGHIEQVDATFVPGTQILLGAHLLRRHRLEIDYPAQTVLIERRN